MECDLVRNGVSSRCVSFHDERSNDPFQSNLDVSDRFGFFQQYFQHPLQVRLAIWFLLNHYHVFSASSL